MSRGGKRTRNLVNPCQSRARCQLARQFNAVRQLSEASATIGMSPIVILLVGPLSFLTLCRIAKSSSYPLVSHPLSLSSSRPAALGISSSRWCEMAECGLDENPQGLGWEETALKVTKHSPAIVKLCKAKTTCVTTTWTNVAPFSIVGE